MKQFLGTLFCLILLTFVFIPSWSFANRRVPPRNIEQFDAEFKRATSSLDQLHLSLDGFLSISEAVRQRSLDIFVSNLTELEKKIGDNPTSLDVYTEGFEILFTLHIFGSNTISLDEKGKGRYYAIYEALTKLLLAKIPVGDALKTSQDFNNRMLMITKAIVCAMTKFRYFEQTSLQQFYGEILRNLYSRADLSLQTETLEQLKKLPLIEVASIKPHFSYHKFLQLVEDETSTYDTKFRVLALQSFTEAMIRSLNCSFDETISKYFQKNKIDTLLWLRKSFIHEEDPILKAALEDSFTKIIAAIRKEVLADLNEGMQLKSIKAIPVLIEDGHADALKAILDFALYPNGVPQVTVGVAIAALTKFAQKGNYKELAEKVYSLALACEKKLGVQPTLEETE